MKLQSVDTFRWAVAVSAIVAAAPALADTISRHAWRDPIIAAAFASTSNDCEGPRKPRVQRTDINRDGVSDAIVWDRADCYNRVGGYFALVTRRDGKWIAIGHVTGRPYWLHTKSQGWPDLESRELHYGAPCFRFYEYRDGRYFPNYLRETERRHCRLQAHNHKPGRK
jgi:hypothetical protein